MVKFDEVFAIWNLSAEGNDSSWDIVTKSTNMYMSRLISMGSWVGMIIGWCDGYDDCLTILQRWDVQVATTRLYGLGVAL